MEMGWKNLEPFCELEGNIIGVRGEIEPTSVSQFQSDLEKFYDHPAKCALGGPDKIQSVALVSGGARRTLPDAAAAGCDAFITGNFDEPDWYIAQEEEIHFFAMGHSATERIGPRVLGEHLAEKFGLDVQFLDVQNPF